MELNDRTPYTKTQLNHFKSINRKERLYPSFQHLAHQVPEVWLQLLGIMEHSLSATCGPLHHITEHLNIKIKPKDNGTRVQSGNDYTFLQRNLCIKCDSA